jgi:hypothetical protein
MLEKALSIKIKKILLAYRRVRARTFFKILFNLFLNYFLIF